MPEPYEGAPQNNCTAARVLTVFSKVPKSELVVQVRLEGNNPYMLMALLTVNRQAQQQQQQHAGVPRAPQSVHGRRINGRHLQTQATTASSFLRMHLPGYVVQALQKLPTANTESSEGSETLELEGREDLTDSPLFSALLQADGALRGMTTNSPQATGRTMAQSIAAARHATSNTSSGQRSQGSEPKAAASGLLAAVVRSSAATCSSVFGDTAGSVVLVDVRRQRAHAVSWGHTHGAHVTNMLGHALEAHVWREHKVHGTLVRTASYGSMHGAHSIVLGTSGLW